MWSIQQKYIEGEWESVQVYNSQEVAIKAMQRLYAAEPYCKFRVVGPRNKIIKIEDCLNFYC